MTTPPERALTRCSEPVWVQLADHPHLSPEHAASSAAGGTASDASTTRDAT